MTQVKFLDLTRSASELKPQVITLFEEIIDSQSFVMGKHVQELEEKLQTWIGIHHCIACSSGTDALTLALRSLNIGPGDEVITPAFSFIASTTSIMFLGAKPVFVDIEPDTFNLDISATADAITSKTKVILPVHLFGQAANMGPLMELADQSHLKVLEDFAQSLGATCTLPSGEIKQVGTIGDIGATSFYPTKNLGGAGDGGMITTRFNDLAETLKTLRIHGAKKQYSHEILGTNSRMDALQAAYLKVKLSYLTGYIEKRRQIAQFYLENLKGLDGLTLPVVRSGNQHVWNQFVVRLKNRDLVQQKLLEKGIHTMVYYPKPIVHQPVVRSYVTSHQSWPESEKASKEVLALPIYPELTSKELEAVVEALAVILS